MNEIINKETNIENMIYEIRGVQVMLDSDLARLYECKNGTKTINLAVKRNINRFPYDFYFRLTEDECSRFQIETLNKKRGYNIKYLPYVFTEQGVAMLATVLHTKVASQTSINVMRAFVSMRKYISSNLIEQNYINNLVIKNDSRLTTVEDTLNKLSEKKKVNSVFFEGQIFDAYIFLMDLLNKAKKEIIIIDNFAGKELFKITKNIKVKVVVVSKNIDEEIVKKYKKQYNNLEIIINNSFHDRFIIIDRKTLYHCGASFKDLGKKCFGINLIDDNVILKEIMKLVLN